jgi:two-component system, OmpR family, response regulator ChvI
MYLKSGFKGVLESAITMISAHKIINAKLSEEKLPLVDYRIIADYGRVEIAKSSSSMAEDLFGATINMCSKINAKAAPNGVIIGSDLYSVLKRSFPDISDAYSFKEKGDYSSGLNKSYPVYEMKSKLVPSLIDPFSSDSYLLWIELSTSNRALLYSTFRTLKRGKTCVTFIRYAIAFCAFQRINR